MLLLVPVHALACCSANGCTDAWSTPLYWFVHVFRLPLFFPMAGFFVALLRSAGSAGIPPKPNVRIGVPLVVGVIAVVP